LPETPMNFALPAPSQTFEIPLDDGARIKLRRFGKSDGIRLMITHGNGFAADAYFPYWRQFLDRYDVLVYDFRNHGQNVPVAPANHSYEQLTRDLERIVQGTVAELGAKTTVGIFHSMSARTAMKHAIEVGWRWDGLVLFDPPDVPPPDHRLYPAMEVFENKLVEWCKTRRRSFHSVQELADEYLASRATRNWVAGEHELMARSVLRPLAGGFELVCAPENEAAIYAQALTLNLWPKAIEFGGPVTLIGCDPAMKGGPATGPANQALGIEGGYDYAFVEGTGHLLQIEKPDDCVRLTLAFLAKHGLAA
jgi:pimeloyl-ACP methyl ester carboxylesterase